MKSTIRKANILEAAYKLSLTPAGWLNLTGDNIAKAANCNRALINYYFSNIEELKTEVVGLAAIRNCKKILEQAKAANHKLMRKNHANNTK